MWQARGAMRITRLIARDTRIASDSVFLRSVSSIALLKIKLVHVWNRSAAGMRQDTQNVAGSTRHENHE